MEELIIISKKINDKITLLETMRNEIKTRGLEKANTVAQYDKQFAIEILKLKNLSKDETMNFEGQIIKAPLAISIIRDIAKGICHKQKLEMEEAEALYKCIITNINTVQAELSGLQSVYKFLDKGV